MEPACVSSGRLGCRLGSPHGIPWVPKPGCVTSIKRYFILQADSGPHEEAETEPTHRGHRPIFLDLPDQLPCALRRSGTHQAASSLGGPVPLAELCASRDSGSPNPFLCAEPRDESPFGGCHLCLFCGIPFCFLRTEPPLKRICSDEVLFVGFTEAVCPFSAGSDTRADSCGWRRAPSEPSCVMGSRTVVLTAAGLPPARAHVLSCVTLQGTCVCVLVSGTGCRQRLQEALACFRFPFLPTKTMAWLSPVSRQVPGGGWSSIEAQTHPS